MACEKKMRSVLKQNLSLKQIIFCALYLKYSDMELTSIYLCYTSVKLIPKNMTKISKTLTSIFFGLHPQLYHRYLN